MKILMVTMGLDIGGAETHILELARELVRRGHDVTVASNGGVFVEALCAGGARHVSVPLHTKNPASMLSAFRTLSRMMRTEHYDVIHAHARIPGFVASAAAWRYDIPVVTTFHGTFNPVWYLRALTRTGEQALAVSEDVRQYLMHYYRMPAERISVTVNGIDTETFSPQADAVDALELPAGKRIFCVTRLDRESAWHALRLIEAMPDIVAQCPDARLVIVGGGDALEDVRALARTANEALGEDCITVTGPRSDVARLLRSAYLFVGVSRAAMEAMACCIPVVLSGAQGHLGLFVPSMEEEAVSTNFCCRGREAADMETMAQSVIAALSLSDAERREMGEYNRSVVRRCYSVSRMADDAEQLYRRGIRGHVYRRGDVVISGYYGFSNAGDDALLSSIAEGLKDRGILRISALSKRGSSPAPGVRAVSRFHFLRVMREIRRARLVISGGGSLLQDATSTKSLVYYTSVIRYAQRVGVPVMVYANGIGPITRRRNRQLAYRAVSGANFISVREEASREELISMGIGAERIHVSADPVYACVHPPRKRRRKTLPIWCFPCGKRREANRAAPDPWRWKTRWRAPLAKYAAPVLFPQFYCPCSRAMTAPFANALRSAFRRRAWR